jgi:hypothetical protein
MPEDMSWGETGGHLSPEFMASTGQGDWYRRKSPVAAHGGGTSSHSGRATVTWDMCHCTLGCWQVLGFYCRHKSPKDWWSIWKGRIEKPIGTQVPQMYPQSPWCQVRLIMNGGTHSALTPGAQTQVCEDHWLQQTHTRDVGVQNILFYCHQT